jgi:putative membrane protein
VRVFSRLRRATPTPLLLFSAVAFGAAFFAVRFPDVPGASAGSYVSSVLIALPALVALVAHLGPRRAAAAALAVSAFAYAIESVGVATGFPYGPSPTTKPWAPSSSASSLTCCR